MTRRICRHEFCWVCTVDWAQIRQHGNRGHNQDCRLYGRNDFFVLCEVLVLRKMIVRCGASG